LLTDSVSLNIFAPTDLTTDKSTATFTVTYGTGTAYGLTLTGGTTTTTTWYAEVPVAEAVTATAGAGAAAAANADNASSVAITPAMTSDANGTALAGVPIVYTVSDGGKLATAATGNLATVWKDTVTANSNTVVYAIGTKPGVVTVTAKGGGLTATRTFTVIAPDAVRARSITITAPATNTAGSAAAYTATVKDGFGNVVPGVNVVFTMSGVGSFLNGSNTVTGTTDSTGIAMASVLSALAGETTVTATITNIAGGHQYEANDGTNKVAALPVVSFIAAVASANVKGTVAAAAAAANPAIDAVKADVKAVSDTVATLSKAVTTIQSSVTELTSSFSAQIKSLSSAIAKISRAIAALSKKIK
jgi:adhesin/invasin